MGVSSRYMMNSGQRGHPVASWREVRAEASSPWLDLKVFYVRVSNCVVQDDDPTPEQLTLKHVPLSHDTILELNCVRSQVNSDGVSTLLNRDRIDKRAEEVTYVNTDSIRVTGSTKFEVRDKEVLVLSGNLELRHDGNRETRWNIMCESGIDGITGVFKGNPAGLEPTIEVGVAGTFAGSPIILTRTLQLGDRNRMQIESMSEYESFWRMSRDEGNCKLGDGELTSLFNAGMKIGVGISIGICVGLGIGVGLLVRCYQGTTRNFRRRLP